MHSRVPRAVGKQPLHLDGSFFDWFEGYRTPAPLARTPATTNYWNAGVNMAYGRETAYPSRSGGDTGLKKKGPRRSARTWSLWGEPAVDVGVEAFNRSQAYMAYGNTDGARAELGDLFNDIIGAIVPGWDARPEALKKIVLKPDANKLLQTAQKIAPNAALDIVRAANENGMQVYVNTPGGQVNITPDNAQFYYGNYQFLTKAQGMFGAVGESVSSLSPMVWLAIVGAGVGLFLMMKR